MITNETILKVARECGGVADDQTIVLYHTELINFAHRIATLQREIDARICEGLPSIVSGVNQVGYGAQGK